ncbi:PREDICTED: alpha-farnesene synthase [Theobroma cacao]|uniref:(+)-delta-cadinene synthase n=1 Tax=Theobroma cacao TaxID=3641 RepID=A0AB32WKK0_THECC|nr:PREDICTED: alpha-farnesene synthase [Theobroma cacao]
MDYSTNQLLAEHQVVNYQLKSEAFDVIKQRRSANYKPNIWKYDFLQSLRSKYDGDEYKRRAEKLREKGKDLFVEAVEELAKLELIDMIRKLGLADLFAEEMQKTLQAVASSKKRKNSEEEEDLYITALRFRILRLHGYEVSQDVFNAFLDDKGKFSKSKSTEIKGLLELFEASYLAFEGESILDDAKTFATETLRTIYSTLDSNLAKEVAHALELSTHWRVQWFDVKWRITMYENNKNTDETFLELAKLNFNTVQATLQKDLSDISRWWKNLALMEHLDFTRDRLAESFLCAVGLAYEPRYSCFRKRLTKITTMILIIDDVYDVYGSLEELEQFTDAVDSWDTSKIQQLPESMKICFQALYDITNEIAYDIQEHNHPDVQALLHLRKAWAGFCKALFVESKWYNEGYFPSLPEYLSNALISSGGTVISVHSMLSVEHNIADDMVNLLGKNHDLVHNVSIIIRLCNDLGTSAAEKERGDAPSSILCYMREVDVSEEEGQEHIKDTITGAWKKINSQCLSSPSPLLQSFVKVTANVARMVHCLYQFGDGFGIQDRETRRHILSLLIEPFKLD